VQPTKDRAKRPRKGKGAGGAGAGTSILKAEEREQRSLAPASVVHVAAVAPKPGVSPTPTPPSASPVQPVRFAPYTELAPQVTPASAPTASQIRSTPSVVDRWAQQPIIGVKPSAPRKSYEQLGQGGPPPSRPESNGIRRPLPGMVPVQAPTEPLVVKEAKVEPSAVEDEAEPIPESVPVPAKSPPSPMRHSRIPSTGSRATVMDVAQVFQEEARRSPEISAPGSPTAERSRSPVMIRQASQPEAPDIAGAQGQSAPKVPPPPAMERRRSSYDKYSAFTLPPLREERTPVSSPAGTLRKADVPPIVEEEPTTRASGLAASLASSQPAAPVEEAMPVDENSGIVHFGWWSFDAVGK
jgi:hypothetical protein